MDVDKLGQVIGAGLRAAEPLQAENLLPVFSDEELLGEVARRQLVVAGEAGLVAVATAVEPVVEQKRGVYVAGVEEFLDAEQGMDVEQQLDVMVKFWGRLGFNVPKLSTEQRRVLESVTAARPDWRVVPTPLLDLNGRQEVAERAKLVFLNAETGFGRNAALWTPDENWTYGKLLRSREGVIKEGRDSYGLGYKTPDGKVAIGQTAYAAALWQAGETVVGEDGKIWTFPVMDVRVRSERTSTSAGELLKKVDPIVTPESLITTQLLHQAARNPNSTWEVDFANEAVYKLGKKGEAVAPVRVASVVWNPYARQVNLYRWGSGDQRDSFGVRGAASGL